MATVARPLRVGIFTTMKAADRAVAGLSRGFTKDQISVVCSDKYKEQYFAEFHHDDPAGTTTPRNALVGAQIGATLGGLATVAGAAATGGAALLLSGGIAAWAGGVFGGLIGAMTLRGVEKEVADYYDQAVQDGKILVAVDLEEGPPSNAPADRLDEAEVVLAEAGAEPLPMREG